MRNRKEEKNIRKLAKTLHIFPTTPDEEEKFVVMMQSSSSDNFICHYDINILNIFDLEL